MRRGQEGFVVGALSPAPFHTGYGPVLIYPDRSHIQKLTYNVHHNDMHFNGIMFLKTLKELRTWTFKANRRKFNINSLISLTVKDKWVCFSRVQRRVRDQRVRFACLAVVILVALVALLLTILLLLCQLSVTCFDAGALSKTIDSWDTLNRL